MDLYLYSVISHQGLALQLQQLQQTDIYLVLGSFKGHVSCLLLLAPTTKNELVVVLTKTGALRPLLKLFLLLPWFDLRLCQLLK